MPPFHRLSHLATATLLGLVAACPAIDLESLTKNSPFGGTARPATPDAAPSTLEFRGMYVDGGLAYYSIYNSLTKQSSWVAEGEAPSANVPVTVKGFEVATETLTIDNEGHPQKMELHQAVVATFRPGSIPVAAPMAQVAPAVAGTTQGGFNSQNLTPEQVDAFRNEMRKRFGNRGDQAPGTTPTDGTSPRSNRGSDTSDAPTSKTGKTPKVR